jgi:ABC-type multidrug transport system fused ATPase/permease subunit
MLPLVARSTQEVLALVPNALREGSLALGAAKWRTTLSIVLPQAIGGIITGATLATARVAGETAPLLFTSSLVDNNTHLQPDRAGHVDAVLHLLRVRGARPDAAGAGLGDRARAHRLRADREHHRPLLRAAQPSQADGQTLKGDDPMDTAMAGLARPIGSAFAGGAVADPVPAPTVFRIENLSAYYGKSAAVRDVTFDVPGNQVTAIIGPSGCGKSTFIRCLNRMNDVVPGFRTEGSIFFTGSTWAARTSTR